MDNPLIEFLECPICTELRRNTHIFTCVNGHNICSVCKDKLAACPQGKCGYTNPPTRNLAIEHMIAALPRPKCTNEGCDYEGTDNNDLTNHMPMCKRRRVLCPCVGECKDVIPFNEVIGHIKSEHGEVSFRDAGFDDFTETWLCNSNLTEIRGKTFVVRHYDEDILVCIEKSNTKVYIWLMMLSNPDYAKENICYRISLSSKDKAKGEDMIKDKRIKVLSIDTLKEITWEDFRCLELRTKTLKSFLQKNPFFDGESHDEDFKYKLVLNFRRSLDYN